MDESIYSLGFISFISDEILLKHFDVYKGKIIEKKEEKEEEKFNEEVKEQSTSPDYGEEDLTDEVNLYE